MDTGSEICRVFFSACLTAADLAPMKRLLDPLKSRRRHGSPLRLSGAAFAGCETGFDVAGSFARHLAALAS